METLVVILSTTTQGKGMGLIPVDSTDCSALGWFNRNSAGNSDAKVNPASNPFSSLLGHGSNYEHFSCLSNRIEK